MSKKERRSTSRKRVLYGASVSGSHEQAARPCVVRNLSDAGAMVEFRGIARAPADPLSVSIDCKHTAYQARVVWRRHDIAGLAFCEDAPRLSTADPEIEDQLRATRKENRQLQRRVRQLLGQD